MRLILILAIFPIGWGYSSALSSELVKPKHSIIISAGDSPFTFGRTISLEVKYHNHSDEPWNLWATPTKNPSVALMYRRTKPDGRLRGFRLGKNVIRKETLPSGEIVVSTEGPILQPLTIAPKQMHVCHVVFQRDLDVDIAVGVWSVWIQDHAAELESNRIEIPLRFRSDSVAACLEIAADKKQPIFKRSSYSKWLQRIDSQLQLNWPAGNASEEEKSQREPEIQKQLKEFFSYWQDAKDSRKVAKIITEINKAAGLDLQEEPKTENTTP